MTTKTSSRLTAKQIAAIAVDAQRAAFRIAAVEDATAAIGTLCAGFNISGLTKGQFSMLDLIRAVLDQIGPAHLTVSTWTMGIRDIKNAYWLVSTDQLTGMRLLVDRSFATRQPQYCRRLITHFGDGCIRASVTHAKFALLRNGRWNVYIRGSMNLNRNRRWENYDITDSDALCDGIEILLDEVEALTPPGPSPGDALVADVFSKALEIADDPSVLGSSSLSVSDTLSELERLAGLGYPEAQIRIRLQGGSDYQQGAWALEDELRTATKEAAFKGNAGARDTVAHWVKQQR